MLDQAFEALKTYDWGTDPNALKPIDEAVIAHAWPRRRPARNWKIAWRRC